MMARAFRPTGRIITVTGPGADCHGNRVQRRGPFQVDSGVVKQVVTSTVGIESGELVKPRIRRERPGEKTVARSNDYYDIFHHQLEFHARARADFPCVSD
jgi:hypothetical protein